MSFWDWSTSASGNNTSSGVNIAEGCPAGNVNNAQRTIMAQIRAVFSQALSSFFSAASVEDARTALGAQTANARLTALAGLTGGANTLPYANGVNSMAQTPLTAFARTLLDDADAAAARTTLGVPQMTAGSNGNGSWIAIDIGGTTYKLQWGSFTASPNTTTARTFPSAYTGTPSVVVSGTETTGGSAQDNTPEVFSVSSSGFVVASARDSSVTTRWIAIGA